MVGSGIVFELGCKSAVNQVSKCRENLGHPKRKLYRAGKNLHHTQSRIIKPNQVVSSTVGLVLPSGGRCSKNSPQNNAEEVDGQ